MNELGLILKEHSARYPLMRPCDAVKLIYQNEFGGGHLINDKTGARLYLQHEYALIEQSASAPLYENIGNGLARLQLAAFDANRMSLEAAFEWFYASSACVHGNIDSFMDKLKVLTDLAQKDGMFSFTAHELKEYLKDYSSRGYPMVSHSAQYRAAYKPAYRVIKKEGPRFIS